MQAPLLFPSIAQTCHFFLCSLEFPLPPLSQAFPTLDLFTFSLAVSPHLGDQGSLSSSLTRLVRTGEGPTESLPPANTSGDRSCHLGSWPSSNTVMAKMYYCAVTTVSPAQATRFCRANGLKPWYQSPNLAPSRGSKLICGMTSEIK